MVSTLKTRSPRSVLLRLAALLLVCIAVSAICVFIGIQVSLRNGAIALEKRLAAMRSSGVALDGASLDAWYKRRTGDEFSAEWLEILDYLRSDEFKTTTKGIQILQSNDSDSTFVDWPDEVICREFLRGSHGLRERIRGLSQKKQRVRFPITFNSFGTPIPNTYMVQDSSRIFGVEFAAAFHDKNSLAMREAITTRIELSEVCRGEPIIVSHLLCAQMRVAAIRDLGLAIKANRLASDDLRSILALLQDLDPMIDDWPDLMASERANAIQLSKNPDVISNFTESKTLMIRWLGPGASSTDIENYLDSVWQYENIDTSSLDKFLSQANQIHASIQQEFSNPNKFASRHWLFTSKAIDDKAQFAIELVTAKMSEQIAILGTGIRLYQSEYGMLPDQLSDLGKLGINFRELMPLGGKPYGYRRQGNEAELWGTHPKHGKVTSDNPLRMDATNTPLKRNETLDFYWELQ